MNRAEKMNPRCLPGQMQLRSTLSPFVGDFQRIWHATCPHAKDVADWCMNLVEAGFKPHQHTGLFIKTLDILDLEVQNQANIK